MVQAGSAFGAPEREARVFVHLGDAGEGDTAPDAQPVAQSDGVPGEGHWPLALWPPLHPIRDRHVLTLPAGTPPGEYVLSAGLYDPESGQRWRSQGPASTADGAAEIGRLTLP